MIVRFAGYFEYQPYFNPQDPAWEKPQATFYHAEFIVTGDSRLPDGAQVNWDTLSLLKLPRPSFPNYYAWRRENWAKVHKVLNSIQGGS